MAKRKHRDYSGKGGDAISSPGKLRAAVIEHARTSLRASASVRQELKQGKCGNAILMLRDAAYNAGAAQEALWHMRNRKTLAVGDRGLEKKTHRATTALWIMLKRTAARCGG